MTPVLELRSVGFAYPPAPGRRGAPFAIRSLSVTVAEGEVLGVIGPNGSGKTTLIRLVSRVVEPASGQILLTGADLRRLSRPAVARTVAVVPQDLPRPFPYTVEDLVLMGRFPHAPDRLFETREDRARAQEAMEATGVRELRGELFERLSGGERQRAVLARALAQEPRLLVLDEPTAHLDLRYQAECVGLLRRLRRRAGLAVLLVSHDLSLAGEVADRLLLLDGGAPARVGPPAAVLDEATLERVYGCRVLVDRHPVSGRTAVHAAWPAAEGG